MRSIRTALCTMTCVAAFACFAIAADKPAADTPADGKAADAKPEEGFVPLFDGKTLNGWVITKCRAEVQDGNLVILEGNGLVRTEKQYGDFILELEWKPRKAEKWDSGIFFRAQLVKLKTWPNKWQVNLLQGKEGELVSHKEGKAPGNAKGGEWNHMRLTVIGKDAEVAINGKPAWKVNDIDPPLGFIAIQVEVPGGGEFEFRNIRVKPLTPPVDPPAEAPKTE